MDIFSVFTLFGGLAFFLFGMNTMSNGLEKMTGSKLEKALKRMTSNPLKSILLGAGITIAIQSSSAVTVMLVGFVNSGIMQLGQTIGIIMGSNIGTTLTAWVLSLSGIKSDNFLIELLKPESFSPIIALIGIILTMISKDNKKKDIGTIMLGFSILMFGMNLMAEAVSPLAEMKEFSDILVAFKNPLLGVAAGAIFTGVIQSSAASIGILQALSMTGEITFAMAIPIIMGQNIGTCATALLSSIGVNKNAKRVAIVHIYFNLIGTGVCLSGFFLLNKIFEFPFVNESISPIWIAVTHSVFNIVTTIVLIPFAKQLERLAKFTIRDKDKEEHYTLLDDRILLTPSVAIAECMEHMIRMAKLVQENLYNSLEIMRSYSGKVVESIQRKEELIDGYEDKLGTSLVKLSSRELSDKDSKEISKMLHVISDFERIGDHAVNIAQLAQEIYENELSFSKEAQADLITLTDAVKEIVNMAIRAVIDDDIQLAKRVEPLEEVIDFLKDKLRKEHIERLKDGRCTIEQGFIFNDLITNCERVSDHCSNIAVCVIQISESNFDTHEYLHGIKSTLAGPFMEDYEHFKKKYELE